MIQQMINKGEFFFFIFSVIYFLNFLLPFLYKLTQEEPEPIKMTDGEKLYLFISVSYIISFIYYV